MVKKTERKRASSLLVVCAFLGLAAAHPAATAQESCCRYAEASALWLRRQHSNSATIGRFNAAADGATLAGLSTGGVDFDYQPGLDVLIGYRWDEDSRIEAGYFGLHDWSERATLANPAPGASLGFSPIFGSANLPAGVGDSFSFSTSSELHNVEINAFQEFNCGAAAVHFGMRYVQLADELTAVADDRVAAVGFGGTERTSVDAENHLVGLQLGAERNVRYGRLDLSLFGKAGAALNAARRTLANSGVAGVFPATASRATDVGFSTMVETGINADVSLYRGIRLFGGYRVLMLSGLALAPDQLDFIDPVPAVAGRRPVGLEPGINDHGELLFHGLYLGAEVCF